MRKSFPARKAISRFLASVSGAWFPVALFLVLVLSIGWNLGAGIGVPTLFRDDPELHSYPWWWIFNSPVVWGHFAATLFVIVIWGGISVTERIAFHLQREDEPVEQQSLRVQARYVAAHGAPFLVLLLLAAIWPCLARGEWVSAAGTLGEALGGMAVAVAAAALGARIVSRLRDAAMRRFGERNLVGCVVTAFRWLATPSGAEMIPAEVVGDFWVFLGSAFVLSGVFLVYDVILPCVAITLVAISISTVYFVVVYVRRSLRLLVVGGCVGAMILFNHDPYSNRFPGLNRYDHPLSLDENVGSGPAKGALAPIAALDAWHREGTRPKLVVVTVSGGAYRAGFWSALVLDELVLRSRKGRELEGLDRAVRVLTGASGGMVASGYFAALAPKDPESEFPSIERTLLTDIKNFRDKRQKGSSACGKFPTFLPIARDGLSPVAQQLVQRDIPRYLFAPFLSWTTLADWDDWSDRGVVLEHQWHGLRGTFSELGQGEREGWRPSIILSPMLVETGQPLLISNLDLSELTEKKRAVELFSLFPESRETLKLQTAVRMNASFPYVSPAVSLPTKPTRRVVDAGYYDNYGVSVAASWLLLDGVRKWLTENTSGVIVIQINAYDSSSSPNEPSPAGIAARFLTSPLEAVGAARDSSMVFRNAEQLDAVSKLFPSGFVTPCVFENRAEKSEVEMSWYLRRESLERMRKQLGTPNDEGFTCVTNAWKHPP